MRRICFYFQVHQPFRLRKYSVFEIGKKHDYFDEQKNREVMRKVAKKCYLPANNLMLELIKKHPNQFKIAYSITGTAIEQFEMYAPEVLQSFKDLAATGCVEFLSETYYHSLSALYSKQEFREQVEMHNRAMRSYFKTTPSVFRNTELIYNNEIAAEAEALGYSAILAEGWDAVLGWRSPNYVYRPANAAAIKLLMKNYKLSDDIAFRFSNKSWKEWPLDAGKYASWIDSTEGDSINIFIDYETFGEHQWEDTGIFNFMKALPDNLLARGFSFAFPSDIAKLDAKDRVDVPHLVSWADIERDVSAWTGNKMQDSALKEIYALENAVKATHDEELISTWRKLLTSDHYYYMCTKYFSDGDVHKYFNPYDSPYDAYLTFMNILSDFKLRIKKRSIKVADNHFSLWKLFKKKEVIV